MSSPKLILLLLLLFFIIYTTTTMTTTYVSAQADHSSLLLMSDNMDLEWSTPMSLNTELDDEENDDLDNELSRRSLLWRRMHYYISYGALSANRIPCPPRSGRSYYTRNCYKASGPVHPYSRGCSRITRCRS